MLVLLAITVPWFALVQMRNPGFAEFFFVREHWQRFTQPGHRRPGPLWYFVPIAIAFLTPWLPALVAARRGGTGRAAFSATRFAWCWAAVILVFFSVSSSKLPAYILPAMGGVAIAGGIALARDVAGAVRITAWSTIALGVAVAALALAGRGLVEGGDAAGYRTQRARCGWWRAGALLAATGLFALWALRRGRRLRALAVLVLGMLAACQAGVVLAWRIDAYFSAERVLARRHAAACVPSGRIFRSTASTCSTRRCRSTSGAP